MKKLFVVLILFISAFSLEAQITCPVNNQAFKDGENFSYKIYYNWGAIWASAGEAGFSASKIEINEKKVWHFVGVGATYPKYDWFYKVMDTYESFADTASLKPLRFKRESHEGGNYISDDYVFDHRKNKVYTSSKKNRNDVHYDSIKINNCTNDVLTAIYYTRCLEFNNYKPNDTIPITFVLDGVDYPSYVRYLGKETINSELLGKVRCIKFRPRLIAGTLFKGGEGMTVWVTDDLNRMPVYVETPILVGTIKVQLLKYTGLRNKLDCLVENKTAPSK